MARLRVRHAVFSTLLIALLAISAIQMAPNCYLRDKVLAACALPLRWLGLQQLWGVFGPEVPNSNRNIVAVVTLKDGTATLWDFPRMERKDLITRAHDEYFRKWAHDNLMQDYLQFLRLDAARFVARRFANANNAPLSVSLMTQEVPIPAPDETKYADRRSPRSVCLFTYYVPEAGNVRTEARQ